MFERILVAIDGSPTADKALTYALELAKARKAYVRALFIVDIPVAYVADVDPLPFIDAMRLQGESIRERTAQRLKGAAVEGDVEIREVMPIGGDVAHQINVAADEYQADVIVLGTHGRRGFRRLALGSVAENCVRQARRPVILVPSDPTEAVGDVP